MRTSAAVWIGWRATPIGRIVMASAIQYSERVADSPNLPPVRGAETWRACPRCSAQNVLLVYRRLGKLVLFCTACDNVWTVEASEPEQ